MAPQLRHLLHRRRYRGQHPSVDTSTSRAPKRARKDAINDSVDRLSDLPDTLLCHILSLIDTKYAVATSVLSKRWRHLYISVPNIILDDSVTRKTRKEESVVDFAMFGLGQIIQRNLHSINLFRLKCNLTFYYHAIKTLVCAAIWRNVKELDLCVAKGHGILPLPPEVFTCRSLVVLKLTGDHEAMPLVVPDLVTLPNLKVLHLGALDLDDSVNRLFQGCRLLEDLCLSNCIYDVDVLDFSFPFLRKLSIKNTDKEAWDYIASAGLVIDTPNLEVFEYRVFIGKYIRMKEPMSNGRAEFDFPPSDKDENLLEFIKELRGLKSLYLSETALEAMYPECNCGEFPECIPSPFEAPPFETLTLLKLGAYSLHILPYILECTPQLEVLLIDKLYERQKRFYEYPDPPETAPICLSEHLRNIEFRFQLSSTHQLESDFETMKYFLQNGKVLERMKISITHWWYRQYYTYPRLTHSSIRRGVHQKLKMLPSFSETCKVVFEY